MIDHDRLPNGAAAAAFVAAGIGCLALGLATTLAEASASLKDALNLRDPVGPLSGKVIVGVLAWLVAWAVLHSMWKGRETNMSRMLLATVTLLVIGFLFTFPPFFEAFAAE